MSGVSKTVVFGGTFDPFHKGHAMMLEAAYEEICPDRMIIIPAGHPYMKEDAGKKLKRLEEKYNLRTKKMERGIGIMCNLSEAIKENAEKTTERRLNGLYKWLFDNGRSADVQKATTDSSYRETLLKEMAEAMVVSNA